MKTNPDATIVPFLVMVDLDQYPTTTDFKYISPEARQQLVKEYPLTPYFKYDECKVYTGLTHEEAKLLAWDHSNDNYYRQKCLVLNASDSFITSILMHCKDMVLDYILDCVANVYWSWG